MRQYIENKTKNSLSPGKWRNIEILEIDPLPEEINLRAILNTLEKNFPPHYFEGLEALKIQHSKEFDERGVNAVYRDNILHVTNEQTNTQHITTSVCIFPTKRHSCKR